MSAKKTYCDDGNFAIVIGAFGCANVIQTVKRQRMSAEVRGVLRATVPHCHRTTLPPCCLAALTP